MKLIYFDDEKAPVCIYPGKSGNVYMRPAEDGVDYISIGINCRKPLRRFLKELGYLPVAETSQETMRLWEECGDRIRVPEDVLEDIHGIRFYGILIEAATRKIKKKIAVMREGIKEIMVTEDSYGNRGRALYTKELFIRRICENMED